MRRISRKQIRSFEKKSSRLLRKLTDDGDFTPSEVQRYQATLSEWLLSLSPTQSNPEPPEADASDKCHWGYASTMKYLDPNMSDRQVIREAKKDGYDSDMVLFLYKELETLFD